MKKNTSEKHLFACYIADLSKLIRDHPIGKTIKFTDKNLVKRVTQILRMRTNDTLVLFDTSVQANVTLTLVSKKLVAVTLDSTDKNKIIKPYITIYLPVLKRQALDTAIYSAVELGASEIQLVTTQKATRLILEKEFHRLHNVMIAAAEQSKQFILPSIYKSKELTAIFDKTQLPHDVTLFCDPRGETLKKTLDNLLAQQPENIGILIGPEGDLTSAEKELLTQNNVSFCALTPTVLRAPQALTIMLGILRSFLK